MLTGRASPHVFNGDQALDDQNVEQKFHGVLARSDVGYLHWSREEMEQDRLPQVRDEILIPCIKLFLSNCSEFIGGLSFGFILFYE